MKNQKIILKLLMLLLVPGLVESGCGCSKSSGEQKEGRYRSRKGRRGSGFYGAPASPTHQAFLRSMRAEGLNTATGSSDSDDDSTTQPAATSRETAGSKYAENACAEPRRKTPKEREEAAVAAAAVKVAATRNLVQEACNSDDFGKDSVSSSDSEEQAGETQRPVKPVDVGGLV